MRTRPRAPHARTRERTWKEEIDGHGSEQAVTALAPSRRGSDVGTWRAWRIRGLAVRRLVEFWRELGSRPGSRRGVSERRRRQQTAETRETSMPIIHTARVTLNEPSYEVDLEGWIFGLSDGDYQACAKGPPGRRHVHGRGGARDGQRRVDRRQPDRPVVPARPCGPRFRRNVLAPASRVSLFHLIPVAAVRWTLEVTPKTAASSDFACTVQIDLPPVLALLGPTHASRPLPGTPTWTKKPWASPPTSTANTINELARLREA
jgi:hypothetical protein